MKNEFIIQIYEEGNLKIHIYAKDSIEAELNLKLIKKSDLEKGKKNMSYEIIEIHNK